MIGPGAWLGMLGGGQLGRMFAMAAHRLGYRVMALDPDPACPIAATVDRFICAPFHDPAALELIGSSCAAVTIETENIPPDSLRALEGRVVVAPGSRALSIAQDRIREKRFLADAGLPTAPYLVVDSFAALQSAAVDPLLPGILKRSRFGYDGKGQLPIRSRDDLIKAFESLGGVPCVLEKRVSLERELSVILARDSGGRIAFWPTAENHHVDGVLDRSIAPARVADSIGRFAPDQSARIATALDYRGVLCVEFFLTTEGALLVNEIAPRPHNSGHYTIDASPTSQFEQQVRVLAGLPLGDTSLRSPVVMQNLLGDLWATDAPKWEAVLSRRGAHLHLYGKVVPRPGRKMGHFTCVGESLSEAIGLHREVLSGLT